MGGVKGNKTKRTGGRAKTSCDVRRRMRYMLKIGPRRNSKIYHIHTPATTSRRGRRTDGRERKEGETVVIKLCRTRYIVQLCFPHPAAGPVVNVTNVDDIFCYIIATVFLSMIKQREIDYVFDQYCIQFYIQL